jgi:26S proteasome non-ATPase regulatory subunit 9
MASIHDPSIPSANANGDGSNGVAKESLTLRELIAEKDRVEEELKALSSVLDSVRLGLNPCSYIRLCR